MVLAVICVFDSFALFRQFGQESRGRVARGEDRGKKLNE